MAKNVATLLVYCCSLAFSAALAQSLCVNGVRQLVPLQQNMHYKFLSAAWTVLAFVALHVASTPHAAHTNTLRQSSFLEWISSIFQHATTTPSPVAVQRNCSDCTCGNINTYRRIVGGVETEVHEYPWMALLLAYGDFYCGASLIDDNYVATAAHCVRGFSPGAITVRLLSHNRKNDTVTRIDRRVAAIFIHERYSSRTFDNDIALIRFKEPVEMQEPLHPVCMPTAGNSYAGETAIATGWGALSEGGSIADVLQEVEVPVLTQEACRSSNYGPDRITDNMLCAGYDEGGKDSCQGDSGGPLHVLANDTNEYQLAGIVSWGEGCARPNSPGVYTRVSNYLDWISQRTRDGCKCSSSRGSASSNSLL